MYPLLNFCLESVQVASEFRSWADDHRMRPCMHATLSRSKKGQRRSWREHVLVYDWGGGHLCWTLSLSASSHTPSIPQAQDINPWGRGLFRKSEKRGKGKKIGGGFFCEWGWVEMDTSPLDQSRILGAKQSIIVQNQRDEETVMVRLRSGGWEEWGTEEK